MTSHPVACRILRMMLIAASCPSKRLAAVTTRTLCLGLYGSGALWPARRDEGVSFFASCKISELMHGYLLYLLQKDGLGGRTENGGRHCSLELDASRIALNSEPSFHCGLVDSKASLRPTSNSS